MEFNDVLEQIELNKAFFETLNMKLDVLLASAMTNDSSSKMTSNIRDFEYYLKLHDMMEPTPELLDALTELGFEGFVGKIGERKLTEIMRYYQSNQIEGKELVIQYANDFKRLPKLTSNIKRFLISNDFNEYKKTRKFIEEGIRIFFINDANVETLKELSNETANWGKILHGFARVSGTNETDFKIVRIEKGSILLYLAASGATVLAIATAVNQVLKIINNSLLLRKTHLELKKLERPDLDNAISDLKQSSEIKTEISSTHISNYVINNYNYKSDDKEEVQNALKHGIEQLIKFYLKGGEVNPELKAKETEENADLLSQLKKEQEQRLLNEKEILKLESDNDETSLLDNNPERK